MIVAVSYGFIITERIHKTIVALCGAAFTSVSGVLAQKTSAQVPLDLYDGISGVNGVLLLSMLHMWWVFLRCRSAPRSEADLSAYDDRKQDWLVRLYRTSRSYDAEQSVQ